MILAYFIVLMCWEYTKENKSDELREQGLLYAKGKQARQADVRIIDYVAPDDIYDFVFLTVKENQVHTALKELQENQSPTIVTMVNTLEPYSAWEALCGYFIVNCFSYIM